MNSRYSLSTALCAVLLLAITGCSSAPPAAIPPNPDSTSKLLPKPVAAARMGASMVGLPEAQATLKAERAGFTVRVVSRDGEDFPVTADYSPTRIDVFVVGGVVTDYRVG